MRWWRWIRVLTFFIGKIMISHWRHVHNMDMLLHIFMSVHNIGVRCGCLCVIFGLFEHSVFSAILFGHLLQTHRATMACAQWDETIRRCDVIMHCAGWRCTLQTKEGKLWMDQARRHIRYRDECDVVVVLCTVGTVFFSVASCRKLRMNTCTNVSKPRPLWGIAGFESDDRSTPPRHNRHTDMNANSWRASLFGH